MINDLEILLLPHQDDFVFSDEPHPAIIGGLGSGKTEGGTKRLLKLMLEDPEAKLMYTMPTYDLLDLRALEGIKDELDKAGIFYTVNKSKYYISPLGYGRIYLRSYDNPNRFVAFEVAHTIVDELDTLDFEKAKKVWTKVTERTRQQTKYMRDNDIVNSIACVTTPDQGTTGFIYEKWVKNPKDGYVIIKASTYDNPFLPAGYVQQILNNYDEVTADLYLRGEFVALNQNKVYWTYNKERHHTDRVLTKKDKIVYYGQDFNVGGNVTILFVIDAGHPRAVYELEAMNTPETVLKINTYIKEQTGRNDIKIMAYPDASGKNESANASRSNIKILKDGGHRVDAPMANPSIRDRINSVNGLFSHDKLLINSDTCSNLSFALESQGYDKKGKPEKSDNHPADDDYNDALGYLIHRRYPLERSKTRFTQRK